ncbi:MAG: cyclase family protein, partial [Pseudomonadota bacterium]|nr:cyclase family protein [Pseudomonadota bacterium]
MAEEAWGRWGGDDERGALNYIGAHEVVRATRLVKDGKVIPLAQPLSARTPVPGHRGSMMHFMQRDGGDYAAGGKRPGGFQFAEDTVVMPLQFGTHIDALCHAWHDDRLYNGFSSNGTRSTTGAARCGIEKMGPIVARGVLLNVMDDSGSALAMGTAVTRA